MRVLSIINKSLRQQLRDKAGLSLSLLTVPFFVVLYWFFLSGETLTHGIIVCNQDVTLSSEALETDYARALVETLEGFFLKKDQHRFRVESTDDPSVLMRALTDKKAGAGIIISRGFSRAIKTHQDGSSLITLTGDGAHPSYFIVRAFLSQVMAGYRYEQKERGAPPLFVEKHLGLSGSRTPFEASVPGLLVFSVILLIFSSSMAVVKEIEFGTLSRLKLTSVSTLELLAGMSAVQIFLGIVSVFLTFFIAWTLGFRSAGSIVFAFFISGIACFASVGIGMVVASISRSQTRAFLVSSVAMFLLLLFSGIVFPRPDVMLFDIGGYTIRLFDFLPTTHMGKGLEKVLTLGASPLETIYESGCLVFLTFFYFGAGAMIFNRTSRSLS